MRNKTRGLSSAELLITIGIIASVIILFLPNFINVSKTGRTTAVTGLARSLNQFSNMIRSQYREVGGTPILTPSGVGSGSSSINVSGRVITVITTTGNPTADDKGLGIITKSLSAFKESYSPHTVMFSLNDSVKDCYVIYSDTTGKADAVTSGC